MAEKDALVRKQSLTTANIKDIANLVGIATCVYPELSGRTAVR
jgi:hypothetical protein